MRIKNLRPDIIKEEEIKKELQYPKNCYFYNELKHFCTFIEKRFCKNCIMKNV